jgi:hypothetical protein
MDEQPKTPTEHRKEEPIKLGRISKIDKNQDRDHNAITRQANVKTADIARFLFCFFVKPFVVG